MYRGDLQLARGTDFAPIFSPETSPGLECTGTLRWGCFEAKVPGVLKRYSRLTNNHVVDLQISSYAGGGSSMAKVPEDVPPTMVYTSNC